MTISNLEVERKTRKFIQSMGAKGWNVDMSRRSMDKPFGGTVYICNVDTRSLLIVAL
jgi:hypothetical protein